MYTSGVRRMGLSSAGSGGLSKHPHGLGRQLFRHIQALRCELRVVGAFGILHKDEVPVELRITGHRTDGVELILGVFTALNRRSQRLRQLHKPVRDFGGAGVDLVLERANLRNQIRMAAGALGVDMGVT